MATTLKTVEAIFENVLDSYESQMQLVNQTALFSPDSASLQNSGNTVWRPVQQHAPIIDGFDLTGDETSIIEESYPATLGVPANDLVEERADDVRDIQFWKRRGEQSGLRQVTELNKRIAQAVVTQGTLFYRTDTLSGFEAIAIGQATMNERQAYQSQRCVVLNDRDNLKFSNELSGRQTLQGRPESTWETGMIGKNIAEFNVFTGSYLPTLVGGASPGGETTSLLSFKPEGGTVDNVTNTVTNIDYRIADIPVDATAGYNVGDKISFSNGGTTVKAIGLSDKNSTDQAMTFTIREINGPFDMVISPKPIALDDPSLTADQAAYANIDTQIQGGATITRLNIDASVKTNIFWDKSSVEVLGGNIPANLFSEFDGNKVVSNTMSNGLNMYMLYDGDITRLTFKFRIFTWYGITIANPSNVGVFTTF